MKLNSGQASAQKALSTTATRPGARALHRSGLASGWHLALARPLTNLLAGETQRSAGHRAAPANE